MGGDRISSEDGNQKTLSPRLGSPGKLNDSLTPALKETLAHPKRNHAFGVSSIEQLFRRQQTVLTRRNCIESCKCRHPNVVLPECDTAFSKNL